VLVHKWTALLRVTLETGFVLRQQRKAATSELLLNVCWVALGHHPFVRFVTIAAAHLSLEHRMVMRQLERCADIQVTLETRIRRLSRINDRAFSAAGLNVQTPGAVTRLATHVLCVLSFRLQASMSRGAKIPHDLFVARCAFL
jgi:hypothetical protein